VFHQWFLQRSEQNFFFFLPGVWMIGAPQYPHSVTRLSVRLSDIFSTSKIPEGAIVIPFALLFSKREKPDVLPKKAARKKNKSLPTASEETASRQKNDGQIRVA